MQYPSQKTPFFLPILSGVFVAILLISTITSTKLIEVFGFVIDGGTLLFPFSYILGDILTEIYGFRMARKIVYTGLISLLLFTIFVSLVGILPADPSWTAQSSYDAVLGMTPRIVLASIIAYFFGELLNSYILASLKWKMHGKYLWRRLLTSSIFGHAVDSALFICIAFYSLYPLTIIGVLIFTNFLWKMGTELLVSPVTIFAIRKIRSIDGEVPSEHISLKEVFFRK